jgi:hypothetical protein
MGHRERSLDKDSDKERIGGEKVTHKHVIDGKEVEYEDNACPICGTTNVPQQRNALLLGAIRLSDTQIIVIRKVLFRGREFIDIRRFMERDTYTGFTRKGVAIPVEFVKDLVAILQGKGEIPAEVAKEVAEAETGAE